MGLLSCKNGFKNWSTLTFLLSVLVNLEHDRNTRGLSMQKAAFWQAYRKVSTFCFGMFVCAPVLFAFFYETLVRYKLRQPSSMR